VSIYHKAKKIIELEFASSNCEMRINKIIEKFNKPLNFYSQQPQPLNNNFIANSEEEFEVQTNSSFEITC
jgi:hypothetical protein